MCKLWCLITPECLLFFAVQRLITWFVWLTSATILSSVNNGHKYTYPVGHIDTLRALFPFGFIYAFHFLALICPALLPRNFSFNLIFFFSLLMQRQVELSSSDWHLSWHSHFNSNSYSFTYSDSNSNFSFRYLPAPPPSRVRHWILTICISEVFISNCESMSQVSGALRQCVTDRKVWRWAI